jgi:hypothetical protein
MQNVQAACLDSMPDRPHAKPSCEQLLPGDNTVLAARECRKLSFAPGKRLTPLRFGTCR